MTRRNPAFLSLALGVALLLAQSLAGPLNMSRSHAPAASPIAPAQRAAIQSQYGQLPLAFEMNEGQAAGPARFVAHGSGYTLALTPSAALLALSSGSAPTPHSRIALPGQPALAPRPATPPTTLSTLLDMQWLGANPNPVVTGELQLPGVVNYFIGNDPAKWRTNIPTYQQVRLHNVYPGVDLVYYGNAGQLEYDFVVAPGANPAAIQLGFSGASGLGVDLAGNLSLTLPGGAIQQDKPVIYQTVSGSRKPIAGGYTLASDQHASFALGAYNPRLPLVIDPAFRFSTFLGGSGTDWGYGIATDPNGFVYIAGNTSSSDFPIFNGIQSTLNGGDYGDGFVTKMDPAGNALIYSTYLGGTDHTLDGKDQVNAIAVDGAGNAYVTGATGGSDFPVTKGAYQITNAGSDDAFVTKFNALGGLVYSSFLGGNYADLGNGIAVDASGEAFVTGQTFSTTFPVTASAFEQGIASSTDGDAFVTKLNAAGSGLIYSTYLGGSGYSASYLGDQGNGIALDASGDAYVTGTTNSIDFPTKNPFQTLIDNGTHAFVTKFNASGTEAIYSTYLGGYGADFGYAIAVDGGGDAFITGSTTSGNFPTQNPYQATIASYPGSGPDAFVTKFNAVGSALIYSTYLGGDLGDSGAGIALDTQDHAYITGYTSSDNFPLANPLQSTPPIDDNAFISKLSTSGATLLFSTYLGGIGDGGFIGDQGYAIAVDGTGDVYVTGFTESPNFPTTSGAFQILNAGGGDAFVTKISSLVPTTTGVFRPSNGNLYLKNANTTGPADITLDYGQPGDQPITGDWTGKGYKSIGIYRNGTFYLRNSNTTGYADIVVPFGASTDVPVAGDWTGKGYDSIGVYRPSTSTFYLRDSNTSGPPNHVVTLGISGDVPIVGDWTAKGYDSVGVFRPSNGIVYLRNSNTTGVADIAFVYGKAGDKPVVGDWTGQGYDTIGVDRNGRFLLRNSNSTGPANFSFYLGVSGDDPIAGPWLAPATSAPPPSRPRAPASPSQHTAATPTRRAPALR